MEKIYAVIGFRKSVFIINRALIIVLLCLSFGKSFGQIAAWDFSGVGSSNLPTFAATTFNTKLVNTAGANNITRGQGAAWSTASNSFRTTGFQNDGIATSNTDYFQITLSSISGYNLSLSTIDAKFGGTSTFYMSSGVTSQFAYSLDGTNFILIGSPVQSTSLALSTISLTGISALQNVPSATIVTLRYYASGQTSTGGWGFLSPGTNGLAIGGTVTTAIATISGAVTASAFTTTYGTSSTIQNFPVNGSNLTANLTASAPAGFEVSSNGINYAPTATFTQASGSAGGTLSIRLAMNAAVTGAYNSQNIVLSSPGATSVNITTAASGNTVNPKAITITGITGNNKTYDGSTTATASGTPTYAGLVNGEAYTVTGAPAYNFTDANVGSGKTIIVTGFAPPSSNYTLTQPTGLAANITPKILTVTGVTALNKVYDGSIVAMLSSGTLVGVINPDIVTFTGIGTFANPNVGTAKTVTSTSTLGGAQAANYTLTQPTGLSADITPGTCTASTSGNVVWDFGAAMGTATPSNTITNLTVSALMQGNNYGSTSLIDNSSASAGYIGASGNYNAGAAARTGSLVTGVNGSAYFEFTLTPATGYKISLTSLKFGSRSTGTGPAAYTILSSLDGYTTPIATGTLLANSNWYLNTTSLTTTTGAANAAVTYRIYGNSGMGTAGAGTANWRIDDLSLGVKVLENSAASLSSSTSLSSCSGATFSYIPTSALSLVTYMWSRAAVAGISQPASSGTAGLNEVLTNTTANPVNVIYNYTINGTNCSNPDNLVTVTVNPSLTPSIVLAITTGANPTCAGNTITFTATPTNGGSAPLYNFRINGTSLQSGSSNIYTSTLLITGDVVSCIITSNALCTTSLTATSNSITMNVHTTATSIAPTAVQVIATAANGTALTVTEGSTPTSRQWYYGSASGGPYFTAIAGATATSYVPNFAVAGSYFVVCKTVYPAPCSITITSNEVEIDVSDNSITTGAISGSPFCSGNTVTVTFIYALPSSFASSSFTAQLSNATGSFAAPVTLGSIASNASGSQSIAAAIPAATAFGAGYRIRVISSIPTLNGTDNGTNLIINTIVAITTQPSTAVQTVCSGAPLAPFTVVATGTSPTYQWYINTTASNSGGAPIGGAIMDTYIPSNTVTGIRYYYVIVGGQAPCNAVSSTVSGAITVNPLPADPTGSVGISANPSCGPTILTFPAATSPLINYWQTTSTGFATTQSTATPFMLSSSGTAYVRTQNSTTGCFSTNALSSGAVTITSADTITNDPSNASVFTPATATFTVTAINAAGYQWQVNTGSGFTNISGATSATYTTAATGVSMNGYTYQVIVSGIAPCGVIISAPATLTVNTSASIWSNPITGASPDPGTINPFTAGDVTDPGLSVSGITRSSALSGNIGQNRFNATNWPVAASIDITKYFSFTLTANSGYHINFLNFVYTGQSSGTGPRNFAIRSSLDGYTSNLGTASELGTTVNLAMAAFQNITSPVSFRLYAWNATGATGTYSINDFTFNGSVDPNCTPTKLIFSNPIINTFQDAVIPSFKVSIACVSNTVITSCNNGNITLSSTGCGLKGTFTRPVVNGVATFDDIYFARSVQSGISFTATYAGSCGAYTPAVSNNFDVNFNGVGAPVTTNVKNENFDGSIPAWAYTTGAATYTHAGPGGGTDVTGIKNFAGNNALAKSYSKDNPSSAPNNQGSANTVTFANVTGLGAYTSTTFSLQIGSIPVGAVGSGAGGDNGEYMYIECSLDGGTTWKKTLTNNGSGDHSFNLSAASPVSLAYDANAVYSSGNSLWYQSAFAIALPPGTTQFRFRMTANNNRTNENWVVDNLLLQGITIGIGTQKPLPIVTAYDILACPGSSNTISFSVANGIGSLSYLWTPNTNISNTTISNPVVSPLVSTTYTGTVIDADACTASANVAVTVPSGSAGSWTGLVSKDYFNCLNWGNGVVPAPTTDVIVPATTNAIELDATSPYAAAFSNTGTVKNISITNNSISFINGNEILTVAGNLTLGGGAALNMTNGGLVNIAGNWDNSGGGSLTAGTGTINYNGAAQNIGLETYNNLTLSGSGVKTAPVGIVAVQGDLVKSGTPVFNANGGTVLLNGSDQSFSGLPFNNLILINGTKTTSGSSIIADSIKLNNGTALSITAGDSITLQSGLAKTARIGQVGTGIINYNSTGKFVVERYISSRKAWRFLAVPTTSTQTIKQAWQEGATNSASNPKAGHGTQITSNRSTWAADGFDGYSLNGPSMESYNSLTDSYVGVATTNAGFNASLGGYMTFIRGNRTATTFTSPVSSTILRTAGQLYTGTQPTINVVSGKITPVNNPYASALALSQLSQSNSIFYYVWDPKRGGNFGYGAFQTLSWNGTDYTVVPGNSGSYGATTNFIESGQAFFVSTLGPGVMVPLNENAKSFGITEPWPFRIYDKTSNMRINLYRPDSSITVIADGVLNDFSDKYVSATNIYDALKRFNFGENLSIMGNGKQLTVRRSPALYAKDTIFLHLTGVSQRQYMLEFVPANLGHTGLQAYLEDKYLQEKTAFSLDDTTQIKFIVNNDRHSFAADRFDIVFDVAAGALPVTITSVKASRQNAFINVQWNVENESGIKEYFVEKSADGNIFSGIGSVAPVNAASSVSNSYSLLDEHPFSGVNYYRIKSIGINGEVKYSVIVKVYPENTRQDIVISPNPITDGKIHLQFSNEAAGKYGIRLLNNLGQIIVFKEITRQDGNSTELIEWDFNLARGIYKLEITKPDGHVKNMKVLY